MDQAFELRKEYSDMEGGSVQLADGTTFDLGKALNREPKGKIVTDDPALADRLNEVEALKRIDPPKKKSAAKKRSGSRAKRSPATPRAAGATGDSSSSASNTGSSSTTGNNQGS